MRTKEQIKAHRDDVIKALQQPCNCLTQRHGRECREGGLLLLSTAEVLSWVLGDAVEYDHVVEHIAADVRR